MAPVRSERDGEVAMIVVDNPPVNALSHAVRAGLRDAVNRAAADPSVAALVIACDGRTFIAGADIREFGKPLEPPGLPEVCSIVEACAKPVVAAIHGTALGGGYELALACHARIATREARIGLPEVKLGIVPGAGGTQRLPRLVGMIAALDLVASGRHASAEEALRLGAIDRLAEGPLRPAAIAFARELALLPPRRTGQLAIPPFDAAAFDAAAHKVEARARGQLSLVRAVEALRAAAGLSIADGLARERAIFSQLVVSDQAKALRHAFFAEREVGRLADLDGVSPRPVRVVGVIGLGTMGAGIAVAAADAGLTVVAVENEPDLADAGRARIAALYDRKVASGRLAAEARDARLARIATTSDFGRLGDADVVVEAVFEDIAAKRAVFARLGLIARADAVLATNTSYLDPAAFAQACGRPAETIGLHFFSPADIMRLVEVVRPRAASREAVATGVALAKAMGKLPVVCGVCDGFVGNRILTAYRREAEILVEDGATPAEVDAAMEAFGFAMGPFAVSDLAGLDIGWRNRRRLDATRDPAARYASTLADRLHDLGRLGQKTGRGFYIYNDGKRAIDAQVEAMAAEISAAKGIARRAFDRAAIQARCRAAIVSEGAAILAEGIVERPLAIDMVMIHGFGYPAWRGGPMFEADALGLDAILRDAGGATTPAPLLANLAREGTTFAAWADARRA